MDKSIVSPFFLTHGLVSTHIGPMVWKYDVIHKIGSTQRISMLSETDRATAMGNTRKKFGKAQLHGFQVMRADRLTGWQTDRHRQTDRQRTDILITITLKPWWGKV